MEGRTSSWLVQEGCGALGDAGQHRLLTRIPASSQQEEDDDAHALGAGVSYGGLCRTLGGSLLKMSPLSLEIKPSLLVEAFIYSLPRT